MCVLPIVLLQLPVHMLPVCFQAEGFFLGVDYAALSAAADAAAAVQLACAELDTLSADSRPALQLSSPALSIDGKRRKRRREWLDDTSLLVNAVDLIVEIGAQV